MPPLRPGSLFTGAPAPRAVLDGRRAPRPLLLLLLRLGQRGCPQFPARTLDARPRGLRRASFGVLRGRLVIVVLLLALGAAAQASRGVQVSGGGGSGTHGSNLQRKFRGAHWANARIPGGSGS